MYRQCNCSNSYSFQNINNSSDSVYENTGNQNVFQSLNANSCSCGFQNSNVFPNTLLYSSSYVPRQYINNVYNAETALRLGSMFPELVSPYYAGQSQEIMNYLRSSRSYQGGCL